MRIRLKSKTSTKISMYIDNIANQLLESHMEENLKKSGTTESKGLLISRIVLEYFSRNNGTVN